MTSKKDSNIKFINEYIAHVRKNDDGIWEQPHLLSTHLYDTSKLAEAFTDKFKSGEWGKKSLER